jgi:hypothetical protein
MNYKPGYYKNLLKKLNEGLTIIAPASLAMKQENLILMNKQGKNSSKQDSDSAAEQSTGPTSIS